MVWKLDGGMAEYEEQIDPAAREAHRATIELAAQAAADGFAAR